MNTNNLRTIETNTAYPQSFDLYVEPRTMPAGWDLSGVLAAQEQRARARAARMSKRLSVRAAMKQIPLNPVDVQGDSSRDYRWDAFSGPSTYPSRWNLE